MTETEAYLDDLWPDEGEWHVIHIFDAKCEMLGWAQTDHGGFETVRFEGDMGMVVRAWVQTEAEVRELFPLAYECEVIA